MSSSTTSMDSAPEPTPTCHGTTYEISAGETCEAVSMTAKISTLWLLLTNNLGAFCQNFPTSGTLCIPHHAKCTPYTIKEGDTCDSIAESPKKTYLQIISWNVELGSGCRDIKRHTGLVICVSPQGREWEDPRPTLISTKKT
ncbi:LysM peptidoglycan-binding domain-containing protein [Candidatus Bathyarchaeota archaeon]|nr:LysM peptidoglycan-binding domain-containing protein [Candidatus Bathyarchaeota archaeon]